MAVLAAALPPVVALLGAPSAVAASSVTVTLSHDGTGARATYTVAFTTGAPLPDDGRITVAFPNGTGVDAACSGASVTDSTDPTLSGAPDACGLGTGPNTLELSPPQAVGAGHALSIRVGQFLNPSNELRSVTATLTTTSEVTPVTSAPYSVLTRSVTRPKVTLSASAASATSAYTLEFATSPGGSLVSTYGRTITVVAPSGTSFAGCRAVITDLTDASGTGSATCATGPGADTLVLTASRDIGSSHQLRVEVTGVRNTDQSGLNTLRVSTTSDRTALESEPFLITSGSPGASPAPTAAPSASPSATPAPTPPSSGACTTPEVSLSRDLTRPGEPVEVSVLTSPGATVELLAYSRPSTTFQVVRSGTAASDGRTGFTVAPGTNTKLYARCGGGAGVESAAEVISVQTALSLTVLRNASRTYTFQGRILPRRAGQLVSLYRVVGAERSLTAQLKTDDSGTYRIVRRFTGSGTFGFLTRTGQTLTNAPGESNGGRARPTAVY